jgi:hypothetical protein
MTDQQHTTRPSKDEYAPFAEVYVSKVPQGDVITLLRQQIDQVSLIFGGMSDADAAFRYAPEKWSLKQMLGHITDTERIFTYRALRIARLDEIPMSGFDEDAYVAASNFDDRSLTDLLAEFVATRKSTLAFFGTLSPSSWDRNGTAGGFNYTVRGLAFTIAGHVEHHLHVVRGRYLPNMSG